MIRETNSFRAGLALNLDFDVGLAAMTPSTVEEGVGGRSAAVVMFFLSVLELGDRSKGVVRVDLVPDVEATDRGVELRVEEAFQTVAEGKVLGVDSGRTT